MRSRKSLLLFGCLLSASLLLACRKDLPPGSPSAIHNATSAHTPTQPISAIQQKQIDGLLRYLPKGSEVVSIVPRLDEFPQQIDAFLKRVEAIRKNDELRRLLMAMQNQIGVNPLDPKSLTQSGFDLTSPLVITTLRQKAENKTFLLLAFRAQDPNTLTQKIKHALTERQMAKETRTKKWKDHTLTTFYSIGLFNKPNEDLSYTILDKNTLLLAIETTAKAMPDPEETKKHTESGAAALETLLQLAPQDSLQHDANLQEALKQSPSSLFLVYTDLKDIAQNIARSAAQNNPTGLRGSRRLPLNLDALRQKMPLRWASSRFTLNEKGGQMEAYLALDPKASAQLKLLKAPKGDAAQLAQAVHKNAILTLKGSLDANGLLAQAETLAKTAGLDLERIYAMITQMTGIDTKKEIVSQAAGHGFLSLYEVDPGVLTEWPQQYRRNPYFLPRYIHLAIVAQVNDPKALQATLEKAAKTFRLGKSSIQTEKGQHGSPIYSLEAWPGARAYWTLDGDVFVYSIGNKALQYSLLARKHPKQRLLSDGKSPILLDQGSQAALLDLQNLQKALQGLQLPFTVRLLLGNVLQQIQGIDRLSVGLSPAQNALVLRGQLLLGDAR